MSGVIIPSHHNPSFESLFNGEVCNSTSRKNCPRALPGRPGLPHSLVTLPGIVAGILASQDDIAPGQSLHVTGHYWAKPTLWQERVQYGSISPEVLWICMVSSPKTLEAFKGWTVELACFSSQACPQFHILLGPCGHLWVHLQHATLLRRQCLIRNWTHPRRAFWE
jgi:hypothetical protein